MFYEKLIKMFWLKQEQMNLIQRENKFLFSF